MIALASSGSRSSISSIEPLMSANNAVTVLRSPSNDAGKASGLIRISGSAVFVGSVGTAGGGDRDVPHSPQKSSPGSLDAPHFGQRRASGPPHFAQNLRSARLSLPHLEQRILLYSGCDGLARSRPCCLLVHTPTSRSYMLRIGLVSTNSGKTVLSPKARAASASDDDSQLRISRK